MKQVAVWDDYRAQMEKLKTTAETLAVTTVSQIAEMKLARATRLTLKELRVSIEHKRKELGEYHLRETQKINADAKALKDIIEPLEERLLLQEQFIERETARIADEKRAARTAELTPFLSAPIAIDLGTMTDDAYAAMLSDARDAHAAKLAREQKEREEAAARAKAEAEGRERIRLENERLKKEAAEREEAARKEREAAAAALAKEREEAARLAREAQAKADAEAKKIREEAAERERVAAEKAKADAEKARKEREMIEAEAAKENARLASIAEKQRQEAAAAHAELERQKAAKAKEEAERAAAQEAAELAPEKEKLKALAKTIRELHVPVLKTDKGIAAVVEIAAKVEAFAGWVSKKADAL